MILSDNVQILTIEGGRMHPTPEEVFTHDLHTLAYLYAFLMIDDDYIDLAQRLVNSLTLPIASFEVKNRNFDGAIDKERWARLDEELSDLGPTDIIMLCFLCLRECADAGYLSTECEMPAEEDGDMSYETGAKPFTPQPGTFDSNNPDHSTPHQFTPAALPFIQVLGSFFPLGYKKVQLEEEFGEMLVPACGYESKFIAELAVAINTEMERQVRLAEETRRAFVDKMKKLGISTI